MSLERNMLVAAVAALAVAFSVVAAGPPVPAATEDLSQAVVVVEHRASAWDCPEDL